MRRVRRFKREVQRWWKQTVCAYRMGEHHGLLYRDQNRLSIYCPNCTFESSGIELETRRVRTLWMWEKQRQRWHSIRTMAS